MQGLWSVIDEATPWERTEPRAYFIAIVTSLSAAGTSESLHLLIGAGMPFMLGLGATFVSAVAGGAKPALLAAAINVGLGLLIAHPGADITKPANLAVFIIFSLCLAFVGERHLKLRRDDRALAWKLTQREHYLQTLFTTLPAPIMICDSGGDLIAANLAARNLFEFGIRSIPGVNVIDLIDFDGDKVRHNWFTAADTLSQEEATRQITGRRLSGEPLDLSIAHTTIKSGEINLSTIYVRDETEMKGSTLRVAALQSQIAQLGRASAVAAMGSAIAHQLNQPLATAANFANAARSHLRRMAGPPALLTSPLDGVVEQLYRAGEIVHGLRDFVQARPTTLQWLNARTAADEAIGAMRFLLEDHRVKARNAIEDTLELWTDRIQFQQVLVNLLTNSVDAVAERTRREITITSVVNDDNEITICIRDSGGGIDAAISGKIFEAFNTTKQQGLGVGLSISRQIVEAHGGRIWLADRSDDTTFCVTLAHRYNDGRQQDD